MFLLIFFSFFLFVSAKRKKRGFFLCIYAHFGKISPNKLIHEKKMTTLCVDRYQVSMVQKTFFGQVRHISVREIYQKAGRGKYKIAVYCKKCKGSLAFKLSNSLFFWKNCKNSSIWKNSKKVRVPPYEKKTLKFFPKSWLKGVLWRRNIKKGVRNEGFFCVVVFKKAYNLLFLFTCNTKSISL